MKDLFGRHVGEEVASQALDRGTRLGGEIRTISALFVDVMASTHLTRRLEATEVVASLNAFFAVVVDAVDGEGGWVDKFEGDGALCVFGAPHDHRDHADRALRSARKLRDRLITLQQEHPELDAGIGVASGDVVAGNVGTETRFEYTVIGPPVNEAARLTEVAKSLAGRVLASASTLAVAGEESKCWRSAGDLELRGWSEPVPAFEPVTFRP